MRRRLKFTITTIRRQSIGERAMTIRIFCPICRAQAETMTAAESIVFLEIENPVFDALIAYGVIHAIETVNGNRQICKNSLLFLNLR